jgi:hypothetical protein
MPPRGEVLQEFQRRAVRDEHGGDPRQQPVDEIGVA